MDLSQNRLVGSVPGWLGTLPKLSYIDLSYNLLTGEVPKEFFHLRDLMSQKAYEATEKNYLQLPIFVHTNYIIGSQQYNQIYNFPSAIYMRSNSLTGSIPVEFSQLKALHILELLGNNFSGRNPEELSNLTNLEKLDLSNNNLSGRIPSSLRQLHFMSYFNVANNSLEGPIPTGSQFDTFPKSYFEGNPLLCGGVLQTSCKVPTREPATSSTTENDELKRTLVIGMAIGYLFGFSSILVVCARQ
ncbi:hypothetical protein N665_5568s0001 [Sinapis alba]|nr:hypothetical protein N665_5568s0001 [Sinapis alba]